MTMEKTTMDEVDYLLLPIANNDNFQANYVSFPGGKYVLISLETSINIETPVPYDWDTTQKNILYYICIAIVLYRYNKDNQIDR